MPQNTTVKYWTTRPPYYNHYTNFILHNITQNSSQLITAYVYDSCNCPASHWWFPLTHLKTTSSFHWNHRKMKQTGTPKHSPTALIQTMTPTKSHPSTASRLTWKNKNCSVTLTEWKLVWKGLDHKVTSCGWRPVPCF